MTLFLIPLVLVAFFGAKVYLRPSAWNDDCLSRASTWAVNGIFVLLVMLSHGVSYLPEFTALDEGYLAVRSFLGQLVVVSFLFYSGYGIHRQLQKRGEKYRKTLLTHRFLKVLFHFDLAVLLFLLLQTILGQRYSLGRILLSLLAWEKLGNSNWYIFAVLCLYLMVWLSYLVFRKNDLAALLSVTVLCGVYLVLLEQFGNRSSDCWYNTIFCFPAGMWFSRYSDRLLPALKKRVWLWALLLTGCVGLVALRVPFPGLLKNPWVYNLWAILFVAGLVLMTMKVKLGNKAICYVGGMTFWLYILQRLPYIALEKAGLATVNAYLYMSVCILCTFLLAFLVDKLTTRLDGLIWRK